MYKGWGNKSESSRDNFIYFTDKLNAVSVDKNSNLKPPLSFKTPIYLPQLLFKMFHLKYL